MTISTKCDKAIGALLSACAAILILITSCDRLTDWKSVSWNHYATGFYLENDLTVKTQNRADVFGFASGLPEQKRENYLKIRALSLHSLRIIRTFIPDNQSFVSLFKRY